jgi:hypothetical protein
VTLSARLPWYRSRLSYRADQTLTVAAAVLGAIAALFAHASPTGQPAVDAVLVGACTAGTAIAAGNAPRRLVSAVACVSAFIAFDPVLAAVALAAAAVAFIGNVRHADETAPGALAASVVLNVILRWDLAGFFGLASLLGIVLSAVLLIAGVRGAEEPTRRWLRLGAGAGVVVLCVLTVGAGMNARAGAADVRAATTFAEQAAEHFDAGDVAAGQPLIVASADRLDRANGRFTGLFGRAALAVPVLAQHVRASDELTAAAGAAARDLGDVAAATGPNALQVRDGRIDVEALRSIVAPTNELVASLRSARRTIAEVDSPWLVAPIRTRLDEAVDAFDGAEERFDLGADAVGAAPALVGADGLRRYLVVFTTPSEARGLGGFVGNYAEIAVAEGRINVTDIGRRADLEDALKRDGARCDGCASQLLTGFGRFGFATESNGGVDPRVWSNLTMSPHFPDVAQAAAVLYPQSGGRPVDGVIAMDPYVLETLMSYTGAIELPALGVTVEPDGAAEYILLDQYVLAGDDAQLERIDALDTLASVVVAELLAGALPGPVDLARDLAPHVAERRLVAWSAHTDEQALFVRAGIAGALPDVNESGRFAFTVDNASANKIETFLERTVSFDTVERPDGSVTTVAVVMLRNGAPSDGLPKYVIGNDVGLPDGSSRTMLTFYVPDDSTEVTVERNGESTATEQGLLSGWASHRHFVDLAAGESTTYRVDLGVDVGSDPDAIVAWEQPLSR